MISQWGTGYKKRKSIIPKISLERKGNKKNTNIKKLILCY